LGVEPTPQDGQKMLDFGFRQFSSGRDAVPFGEARAAARGRRVLSDEGRMAPHRRLTSVVWRLGRRQPLPQELSCVLEHGFEAAIGQVGRVFRIQPKTAAELRSRKRSE
jgi:hypothetical protein